MPRPKSPATIRKEQQAAYERLRTALITEIAAGDGQAEKSLTEMAVYLGAASVSGLTALKESGLRGQEIEVALEYFEKEPRFTRLTLRHRDEKNASYRALLESIADPDFVQRVKERMAPEAAETSRLIGSFLEQAIARINERKDGPAR